MALRNTSVIYLEVVYQCSLYVMAKLTVLTEVMSQDWIVGMEQVNLCRDRLIHPNPTSLFGAIVHVMP